MRKIVLLYMLLLCSGLALARFDVMSPIQRVLMVYMAHGVKLIQIFIMDVFRKFIKLENIVILLNIVGS